MANIHFYLLKGVKIRFLPVGILVGACRIQKQGLKIRSVTKDCITERFQPALGYAAKLICSLWAFYRFIVRRSTIVARAYQVRSLSIARTNDIRETSAIKGRAIGTCTDWIGGSASYGIHFFGRDAFVKNMYK